METSLLLSMPTTLLGSILALNGSISALRLWMTGSILLQRKLASGVTRIALYDRRLSSEARFPKFLEFLHSLRELSIHRDFYGLANQGEIGELLKRFLQRLQSSNFEFLKRKRSSPQQRRFLPPTLNLIPPTLNLISPTLNLSQTGPLLPLSRICSPWSFIPTFLGKRTIWTFFLQPSPLSSCQRL